jgi:hypothetical protein
MGYHMKYVLLVFSLFAFSAQASWWIPSGSITQSKLAPRTPGVVVSAGGMGISTLVTSFSHTGDTLLTAVTGASVILTTTGRPVMVAITSSSSGGYVACDYTGTGADTGCGFSFLRSGTTISTNNIISFVGTTAVNENLPCSVLSFIDTPAAGTYTYSLSTKLGQSGDTAALSNCYLNAYEL